MYINATDTGSLPNLLGAFALALGDAQIGAARKASGLSSTANAAVISLGLYDGETIGALARVIGVTHSVAVRLSGQLVADGLVERVSGHDKREVGLRLTAAGHAMRTRILAAREDAIDSFLGAIGETERASLRDIVSAMLVKATTSRHVADRLCRFCDEGACGGNQCPVERRACAIEAAVS
jgi:DNA-binding MarR family transcriptional regulator